MAKSAPRQTFTNQDGKRMAKSKKSHLWIPLLFVLLTPIAGELGKLIWDRIEKHANGKQQPDNPDPETTSNKPISNKGPQALARSRVFHNHLDLLTAIPSDPLACVRLLSGDATGW